MCVCALTNKNSNCTIHQFAIVLWTLWIVIIPDTSCNQSFALAIRLPTSPKIEKMERILYFFSLYACVANKELITNKKTLINAEIINCIVCSHWKLYIEIQIMCINKNEWRYIRNGFWWFCFIDFILIFLPVKMNLVMNLYFFLIASTWVLLKFKLFSEFWEKKIKTK